MKTQKRKYTAPVIEYFVVRKLPLLANLSLDGEVEDWEDLGEI